jgi:uncharacterized protein
MFGLPSLSKLLVLALVIAAVWYGFKFLGRLDSQRKEKIKSRGGSPKPAAAEEPESETVAMVACRQCGAYVPESGKTSCEHEGCPMLISRRG